MELRSNKIFLTKNYLISHSKWALYVSSWFLNLAKLCIDEALYDF